MPRGKVNGSAVAKPAVKRKPAAARGHKLAEHLPEGELLTDSMKKQWRLGKAIGSGGFGELYLASPDVSTPTNSNAEYVVKIEPHSNGPLFCELHFYQRVAKREILSKWMATHKVKKLGMPSYIASGTHEKGSNKFRFMVMQRFGTDLQKLFEATAYRFSRKNVLMLGIRLLDTLQYIHDNDYVHADIKASNLLMGYIKGTTDQVYLVDFGLAYKYKVDGKQKPYKEDPKRAHDGTIEFTSRDAHKGVSPAPRGDLEILGYCLLQWLCGKLPWENKLSDKNYVRDQKIKYMDNIPGLMTDCFPSGDIPDEISSYLHYVKSLDYMNIPDYSFLQQLLKDALKRHGYTDDGKFDFSQTGPSKTTKPKRGSKRRSDEVSDAPTPKRRVTTPLAASVASSSPPSAATPARKTKRPKKLAKQVVTTATQTTPTLRRGRRK